MAHRAATGPRMEVPMLCPHCGERALAADQRFCHACGARLGAQPAEAAQTGTMLSARRVAPA